MGYLGTSDMEGLGTPRKGTYLGSYLGSFWEGPGGWSIRRSGVWVSCGYGPLGPTPRIHGVTDGPRVQIQGSEWYLGSEMGYFGGPERVNLAICANTGYPPREGPETVERA